MNNCRTRSAPVSPAQRDPEPRCRLLVFPAEHLPAFLHADRPGSKRPVREFRPAGKSGRSG